MANYNFAQYNERLRHSPISSWSTRSKWNHRDVEPVCGGRLDLDDINKILEEGDIIAFRRLSHYYYRISGIYRNVCLLLANLPLYQTLVTPVFDIKKKAPEDVIIKRFYQSVVFVDNLEVPINFSRISLKAILDGTYYGILREEGEERTIQDLPDLYCRTNFKDCSNLNIVEFNVQFFETFVDEKERNDVISTYPKCVRDHWRLWKGRKMVDPWVAIPAAEGGCCFRIGDGTPLFISAIPVIYQLEKAIGREALRDENELYKLLIQRMPIEKGELVFQLEEVADIHASVADMLKDIDTVDVLTTFGETSLESIQDTNASSQSSDRLDKYKDTTYDSLGISSLYFNADTSSSMPYANAKDESLISMLTEQYAKWIEYQVNKRFSKSNLTFDVSILPTTRINRKEIQSQLFQGAQYGYSKMAAGVATGIKQINMIPIMLFENDYLHMSEKMMPLMSTYTTSGDQKQEKINGGKAESTNSTGDISSEGGRPALAAADRTDKTQSNIDGKG